eukprot:scaffold517_cov119-Cylindrotheca_fusiformis.AAC.25
MFGAFLRCSQHQRLVAISTLSVAAQVVPQKKTQSEAASTKEKEELFEGQCLKRQLHQPKVPYPAWDYNWDGKAIPGTTDLEGHKSGKARKVKGKTRHILLVRHGQYDETSREDEKRKLTALGRVQATKTGKRLGANNQSEWARGSYIFEQESFNGPCPLVPKVRVSNMLRAKETAQLIVQELGSSVQLDDPDPLLNEALPSPMIPIRSDIKGSKEEIDANHDRIEQAFQKYFYRHSAQEGDDEDDDEFEIIVCHGNVIRITYLMVRPSGTVSARMLGDIGHLSYEESTFSGFHGLKW